MGKAARERPKALVLAEHGEAPLALSKREAKLVDEACRRGHDMADQVESEVTAYGRWLLEVVFEGDAAVALDRRTDNRVWMELVRRAGGPTLRVSRHMLYTALQLAARDARIGDQAWRGLDAARKELLLPLRDDKAIRRAARHVADFNLSQAKTRAYVTSLLAESARPRQVRLTAPGLEKRVRALHDTIGGASIEARVKSIRSSLEAPARDALASEIEALRDTLAKLARTLRGR